MSTERNHPRDQNSPQVEAMMNDLRANAAGIGIAAAYPRSPDDTFDIPAGLIPGCDNKLPKSGLLLIYVHSFVDNLLVEARCKAILEAIGEHVYVLDDGHAADPTALNYHVERQNLRELRTAAEIAGRLAVVMLPLPHDRHIDTLEMEADASLYFYSGVSGYHTIIERGKLRRGEQPKDTNRALSL